MMSRRRRRAAFATASLCVTSFIGATRGGFGVLAVDGAEGTVPAWVVPVHALGPQLVETSVVAVEALEDEEETRGKDYLSEGNHSDVADDRGRVEVQTMGTQFQLARGGAVLGERWLGGERNGEESGDGGREGEGASASPGGLEQVYGVLENESAISEGKRARDVSHMVRVDDDDYLEHGESGGYSSSAATNSSAVDADKKESSEAVGGSIDVGQLGEEGTGEDIGRGARGRAPSSSSGKIVPSGGEQQRSRVRFGTPLFYTYAGVSLLTVLFAGFASGMTVGLLSLDPIQLKVSCEHGTEVERARAQQVSALVEDHHLLLVTLLLANAVCMEALPIFLDRLMPSWLAVVLSVTCILFFGEVLPQALCTGPQQLRIAAAAAPAVKVLIVALYVLSWPIAKLLDWLLGHESGTYYSRPHLKTLIRMHQKERRGGAGTGSNTPMHSQGSGTSSALGHDEVVVIEGALDLASKTLQEIMMPLSKVYMLEWNTKLTKSVMQEILRTGHSRIPIYRNTIHNIRGLLLVKSLILVNPADEIEVNQLLAKRPALFQAPNMNVYDLLNEFQKGSSHMAFLTEKFREHTWSLKSGFDVASDSEIIGIVTLEDVIEELIQEEIYDEFDSQNAACFNPSPSALPSTSEVAQPVGATPALLRLNSLRTASRIGSVGSTCPAAELSGIPPELGARLLHPPPHSGLDKSDPPRKPRTLSLGDPSLDSCTMTHLGPAEQAPQHAMSFASGQQSAIAAPSSSGGAQRKVLCLPRTSSRQNSVSCPSSSGGPREAVVDIGGRLRLTGKFVDVRKAVDKTARRLPARESSVMNSSFAPPPTKTSKGKGFWTELLSDVFSSTYSPATGPPDMAAPTDLAASSDLESRMPRHAPEQQQAVSSPQTCPGSLCGSPRFGGVQPENGALPLLPASASRDGLEAATSGVTTATAKAVHVIGSADGDCMRREGLTNSGFVVSSGCLDGSPPEQGVYILMPPDACRQNIDDKTK